MAPPGGGDGAGLAPTEVTGSGQRHHARLLVRAGCDSPGSGPGVTVLGSPTRRPPSGWSRGVGSQESGGAGSGRRWQRSSQRAPLGGRGGDGARNWTKLG